MPLNPNAPPYYPPHVQNGMNFNGMMANSKAYGNNMVRANENAAIAEAVAVQNGMMANNKAYRNNMVRANENAAIAEAVAVQNRSASSRRRKNRKDSRKSRKYSGGGVDNMVLQMPKVGYTQLPSDSMGGNAGVLADGKTPFMLNVPYSTSPSPASACMKGGKRGTKSFRKMSKKTRKTKKSKKSRKTRGRKH